ncbi:MAG: CDGSH iron-sulfur domain-containing protein [Planctomycetia bacterium]|nr:CDGSH iron-sulfur domain-containing protein [Planctomycetia bacterium]
MPIVVTLEPGAYYWCTCGETKKQPFCDGSHKGTGYEPQVFTMAEKKQVAICNCQHTHNPPFCDGTHFNL